MTWENIETPQDLEHEIIAVITQDAFGDGWIFRFTEEER